MSSTSERFVPPFCPRTDCRHHRCTEGWRWKRFGFYTRQCEPRLIPRFRCGHCGTTFSTQTFSTTYYLKRPELLVPLYYRVLACSGFRQMAREARCAHSTLVGQAARLGRHGLLLLAEARPPGPLEEPIVVDGFEGYAYSQYHPLHLNFVVGAGSHYGYGFTHSRLRRKGRMTAGQRRRREAIEARHGRPDPRAIELDMAAALRIAAPAPQPLTVRSDEHPAYPRALRRLPEHAITHEQTPSVLARTAHNPLFPVNAIDLDVRHNSANHKRETIAFSKRHQAVIERAAALLAWRNFGKPLSANHDPTTAAMRLGLRSTPQSIEALLASRRFPSRIPLPQPWMDYYRRLIDTPGIAHPRRHDLRRAF